MPGPSSPPTTRLLAPPFRIGDRAFRTSCRIGPHVLGGRSSQKLQWYVVVPSTVFCRHFYDPPNALSRQRRRAPAGRASPVVPHVAEHLPCRVATVRSRHAPSGMRARSAEIQTTHRGSVV